MSDQSLSNQLVDWIETSYHRPGSCKNLHCFRVFRSVPMPDGQEVAAVSVRHQRSKTSGAPEHFVVELWNMRHGPIEISDVRDACLGLAFYRAEYAQILEDSELKGLRRRHRLSVHANVMGTEVRPSAAMDLLSLQGREVAPWTYRVRHGRTEFDPYYGEAEIVSTSALTAMLDHLVWEMPEDQARASEAAGSNIPIFPTTR
jgi:hypothetical protein